MHLEKLELGYKIRLPEIDQTRNSDCQCNNIKCQQMRQELIYFSNLFSHDSSSQTQQHLRVYNSPGKSSEFSNLESKNGLLLGTNGNEMIDLNFIPHGSFQQLDDLGLEIFSSNLNYKNCSISSAELSNDNTNQVFNSENRDELYHPNQKQNSDYIKNFNKKRHELETSI